MAETFGFVTGIIDHNAPRSDTTLGEKLGESFPGISGPFGQPLDVAVIPSGILQVTAQLDRYCFVRPAPRPAGYRRCHRLEVQECERLHEILEGGSETTVDLNTARLDRHHLTPCRRAQEEIIGQVENSLPALRGPLLGF
jgi:hypothetical protein